MRVRRESDSRSLGVQRESDARSLVAPGSARTLIRPFGPPSPDGRRNSLFLPLAFDGDPRPFHGVMPYRDGCMQSWRYSRVRRARAAVKPLSHRERGWGEGMARKRLAEFGGRGCGAKRLAMFDCTRLRPYPHPALRATFSRREKEQLLPFPSGAGRGAGAPLGRTLARHRLRLVHSGCGSMLHKPVGKRRKSLKWLSDSAGWRKFHQSRSRFSTAGVDESARTLWIRCQWRCATTAAAAMAKN
ncbi:hypothetical protein NB699_001620 [Xanthomonas sacchari]|nr:hypothetical protein [Xanthomonas sacchari]MCW0440338.1 hypothetical protein [Xanthomonas sacchari]